MEASSFETRWWASPVISKLSRETNPFQHWEWKSFGEYCEWNYSRRQGSTLKYRCRLGKPFRSNLQERSARKSQLKEKSSYVKMQKHVKVAGDDVFTELYQRLLAISYSQGQPTETALYYELSVVVFSLLMMDVWGIHQSHICYSLSQIWVLILSVKSESQQE